MGAPYLVTWRLPDALARFAEGQLVIPVEGTSYRQALAHLVDRYPALRPRLVDSQGDLQPHLALLCGERWIDWSQVRNQPLDKPVTLEILFVAAGG